MQPLVLMANSSPLQFPINANLAVPLVLPALDQLKIVQLPVALSTFIISITHV